MKQWHIHERIEILIENLTNEKELHRFEISLNEAKNLKWERAGKEFWMNGRLYDVAYSESTPNSIVFYCINDTEEAELFAQFDASLQKQLDTKNDASNPIKNILKKDIPLGLPEYADLTETNNSLVYTSNKKNFFSYLNFYSENTIEKISPPPQC